MSKGDYIIVKHRVGDEVIAASVVAERAGRQVDSRFITDGKINWYQMDLQSRSGKLIESVQVPADQILSITTHKKDE